MKRIFTGVVVLAALLLPTAAQAQGRGSVDPREFRGIHVSDARWQTEHTIGATGRITKRWTGDDGYRYQIRHYHSSWVGSQIRLTYVRLASGSRWLVVKKQWCNLNDYGPLPEGTPPPTPLWLCKDGVWVD
jgi:hypothetical protein